MHVRVTRHGGIAGITLQGEAETDALPARQARAAQAALDQLVASQAPTAPGHPDGFVYEVVVGNRAAVTLDENDISEALRPLIDAAMDGASLS